MDAANVELLSRQIYESENEDELSIKDILI